MSDLPKVKNYDVKVRIKNQDLPKARISDKTINFDFPKVNSASIFLDLQTFRKGEKQRELIPYKEDWLFLIFHIWTVALWHDSSILFTI